MDEVVTIAAGEVAPVIQENTVSRLAAAFAAEGNEQVDKAETPEVAEEVEPKAEEVKEEPKAEEAEEIKADDAEEEPAEADFNAVSDEIKFLSEDELREKYPRNASKALIAEMSQYSAAAKEGHELKQKLGGEHFIEPAIAITEALRKGEPMGVFDGIDKAAGAEGLLNVIGQAMYVAHVHSKELAKDPAHAPFAKALSDLRQVAFQSEFGDDADSERVKDLIELDRTGAVDLLKEWLKTGDIDYDQWEELQARYSNPEVQKIAAERDALKRQLEEKEVKAKSVDTQKEREIETNFGTTVNNQIGNVLSSVIWKNSPLKVTATDKADLKESKEFFREQLKEKAVSAFNRSDARQRLLEGVKQGKQNTATFQKDLTDAVHAAILATKPDTAKAEKMLTELYGKTRNAQLVKTPPPEKLAPTVINTPQPAAPNPGGTKQRLTEYFSSQPS